MKNFRVRGALKEDGSLIDEVVVALSEDHATKKANAAGVAVSGVSLIHADDGDQPRQSGRMALEAPDYGALAPVRVPMLISGITNVLVGLFWASTVIGIVVAVPLWVLAMCEFITFGRLGPRTRPNKASDWALTLGVFECLFGLFNIFALACGVVVLFNRRGMYRALSGAA